MSSLRKAAERLHHLHLCEQEGMSSGAPKPEDFYQAVEELGKALEKAEAQHRLGECNVSFLDRVRLHMAWAYCDREDKSTEFMLQFLQDETKLDLDTVLAFLAEDNEEEAEQFREEFINPAFEEVEELEVLLDEDAEPHATGIDVDALMKVWEKAANELGSLDVAPGTLSYYGFREEFRKALEAHAGKPPPEVLTGAEKFGGMWHATFSIGNQKFYIWAAKENTLEDAEWMREMLIKAFAQLNIKAS